MDARYTTAPRIHAPAKRGKTLTIVLVAAGVIGLGIGTYYLVNFLVQRKKEDEASDEGQVIIEEKGAPVPTATEKFPLNVGMRGDAIRRMQQALIKAGAGIPAGATGYFGQQTLAALKVRGYTPPISEPEHKMILLGQPKSKPAQAPPFKTGQTVRFAFQTSVWSGAGTGYLGKVYPGSNATYQGYSGKYSKVKTSYYDANNKVVLNRMVYAETANLRSL